MKQPVNIDLPVIYRRKKYLTYGMWYTEFFDETGRVLHIIPANERQPSRIKTIDIEGVTYLVEYEKKS